MNLRASSGVLIISGWPGARFPGAAAVAGALASSRSRWGSWRRMTAAAPRPITKMVAKATAKAAVMWDRAWAAGCAAGESGGRGAAAAAPVPTPAALTAGDPTRAPHSTQNFAPAMAGVPHCGQNRIRRFYRSARSIASGVTLLNVMVARCNNYAGRAFETLRLPACTSEDAYILIRA